MKTFLFNLGFKITHLLTDSSSLDNGMGDTETTNAFFSALVYAGTWLWNGIMTFIYAIVKFALNIVDFVQYFVQRLIGIDYWLNTEANLADIGESDILFRFMFSDQVLRVFRLLIIIAIVLLIVFSIIAIVKSEYASATSGGDNSKKGILKSALNAIFLVIIIPIMLTFGVLASNAVLASLLNAISPDNNNLTLGGQIFVASAYGANRYRTYVEDGERNPATFSYTFAYNRDGNYFQVVGTDYIYYIDNEDEGQKIVLVKSPILEDKITDDVDIINNIPANLNGNRTSKTQYYSFTSLFDAVNPSDYNSANPYYGFLYYFESDTSLTPKYYLASFDYNNIVDKLAKYYFLENVFGTNVVTSNLSDFQANDPADSDFLTSLGITLDNMWQSIKSAFTGKDLQFVSGEILLDSCPQSSFIIQAAYNTWRLAGQYKSYTQPFANSVTQNVIEWTAESGVTTPNGLYYTNNTSTWAFYDGGTYGMTAIPQEYEVMADFIDFAVRMGVQFHIVNSQSALIDWSRVNQNNYYVNEETGLIELAVNYKDLGTVVYKPSNTESEEQGAIYLMCLYDDSTGKYVPVVPNREYKLGNYSSFSFESSHYGYASETEEGLVIARGVFDSSFSTQPTIIREIYEDESGNAITSGTPTYTNIITDGMSANTLALSGKLDVSIDSGTFLSEVITSTNASTNGSSVVEYTYLANNLLKQSVLENATSFDVFRKSVFSVTPSGGFTYANGSRENSVYYSSENNCIYVKLLDSAGKGITITLTTGTVNNSPVLLAQIQDETGNYINSQALLSATNLQQVTNYIYDGTGTLYATSSGNAILIDDYFRTPTAFEIDASNVYLMLNLNSTFKLNASSLIDILLVSNFIGTQFDLTNATLSTVNTESLYTLTRVWTGADKTGNVFDIYIYNDNITIIPYHNYRLSSTDNTFTTADVSGLNIGMVVGYDQNNTYIRYNNYTFIMNRGQTTKGVNYYYINDTTTFSETKYVVNFYDAFAYRQLSENGEVGNDILDLKANSAGETEANTYANILESVRFNFIDSNNIITDLNGNYLYGIRFESRDDIYRTAYIYSQGQNVLKITFRDANKSVQSFADLIELQTSQRQTGEQEWDYITDVAYSNVNYKPIPAYTSGDVQAGARIKPAYIQYSQDKISKDFIAFDVNFGGLSSIRLYIKILTKSNVKLDDVFKLNNGSFLLDYNFHKTTGIALKNIYMPAQLNIIILLFATVIVFKILMQSAWGLVKRIYDITILFMVMPGFASTLPIDGGSRFGKWKEELIKSVFAAYGVMIGLNVFFVLVPIINNATSNIFTYADLPSTIINNPLFKRPEYLNELVKIMFTLVALTLLQTLPGFFSGLLNFGDVYKQGGEVRQNVGKMVKDVTNVTSGKALMDAVAPVGKDGKRHANLGALAQFIPGSAIASSMWDRYSGIRDGLREQRAERERDRTNSNNATSPFANSQTSTDDNVVPNNAGHSSTSDMAGSARRITQVEDEQVKEFKGTNGNLPTGLMDAGEPENEMAKWVQEYNSAVANGEDENPAYQKYAQASSDWVKANVNNAMVNGEGEFLTREADLDEINKTLGTGFEATAYKTGEKDEITGESIWAVKVNKVLGGADLIDKANKEETRLTGEINNFDAQINSTQTNVNRYAERYNEIMGDVNSINNKLSSFTNSAGLAEFSRLNDENEKHNKFITSFDNSINEREANNVKLREQSSRIDNQLNELQAKYDLREKIIPGNDADKNKWLAEMKTLREQKTGIESQISNNNRQIDEMKVAKAERVNKVKENNATINAILGGNNSSTVQSLLSDREKLNEKRSEIVKNANAEREKLTELQGNKAAAERDLTRVKEGKAKLITARQNARGTQFAKDAINASARYEQATKVENHLNSLQKVIASDIPKNNKEKAIDVFIDTYYKNVKENDKQKLKAQLSTSSGILKAQQTIKSEKVKYETIARGAQARANKINGTHDNAPLDTNNNGGGFGGTSPNTTGGGSSRSASTNSTSVNRPSATGGTTQGNAQYSSSSTSGSGNYAGQGTAQNAKPRENIIKRTGNRIRKSAIDFVKPNTQGDKLVKLNKKRENLLAKGKVKKANKIGDKMVLTAAESKTIREKADADYIKQVENITGGNYKTVEEAKTASQKHNQTKTIVTADGKTMQVANNEHDAELLRVAEMKREKAYNKSKLSSGKNKNVEQFENAKSATKNYAKAGLNEELKRYQTKVGAVKRKEIKKGSTSQSIAESARKVKSSQDKYNELKDIYTKIDIDLDNVNKKEIKEALKNTEEYKSGEVTKKELKEVAKETQRIKNENARAQKAKKDLKRSPSARAINSLNIDNDIDDRK